MKKNALIILTLILCIFVSFKYVYKNSSPVFNENDNIKLPIIMYHHIIDKKDRVGKFIISPKNLIDDLNYIKSNGFETITPSDLVNYFDNNVPLPKKPIMLTFDDGHESFYKYAYPLLKEYEMKAVLSIVGEYTENYSKNEDHNVLYSYSNWKQINELANSPYVEIANHTYNLHKMDSRKGVSKKNGETIEQYEKFLKNDILKLQENITKYTAITPKTFTYPFGRYSKETKEIIKNLGFRCILTCDEKINNINKLNKDIIYELGRFNREGGTNSKAFFDKILKNN